MNDHYMYGMLNIGQAEVNWLDKVRHEWIKIMHPNYNEGRPEPGSLICLLPPIPQSLLDNCNVFTNRHLAIKSLFEKIGEGGIIAEVGTQEGFFARFIIENTTPSELHLFDIDFSPLERTKNVEQGDVVSFHKGMSWENLEKFPDEYFDLIYLDADHIYKGVKKDANVAIKKIKKGGFIVFNDYVLWTINEFSMYGVARALHELTIENNCEWEYIALHPYMHMDVALKRIE